jgi:hypothetical protein
VIADVRITDIRYYAASKSSLSGVSNKRPAGSSVLARTRQVLDPIFYEQPPPRSPFLPNMSLSEKCDRAERILQARKFRTRRWTATPTRFAVGVARALVGFWFCHSAASGGCGSSWTFAKTGLSGCPAASGLIDRAYSASRCWSCSEHRATSAQLPTYVAARFLRALTRFRFSYVSYVIRCEQCDRPNSYPLFSLNLVSGRNSTFDAAKAHFPQ